MRMWVAMCKSGDVGSLMSLSHWREALGRRGRPWRARSRPRAFERYRRATLHSPPNWCCQNKQTAERAAPQRTDAPLSVSITVRWFEHRPPHNLSSFGLEMILFPMTSRSIFVLRKQSNASCGLQTTGSFSLKDVFRTIGTPVSAQKL